MTHNDFHGEYPMIIEEFSDLEGLSNKSKCFQTYRAIIHAKYGQLPKGVRRRLGICCETAVRDAFPNVCGDKYVNYKRITDD